MKYLYPFWNVATIPTSWIRWCVIVVVKYFYNDVWIQLMNISYSALPWTSGEHNWITTKAVCKCVPPDSRSYDNFAFKYLIKWRWSIGKSIRNSNEFTFLKNSDAAHSVNIWLLYNTCGFLWPRVFCSIPYTKMYFCILRSMFYTYAFILLFVYIYWYGMAVFTGHLNECCW